MPKVIDFSRSFITFRIDTRVKPPRTVSHEPPFSLNNARIQVECRCRIIDKQTLGEQMFVLGASCKTERVGVASDIWTQPNADFAPIFSASSFMNIKTYAQAGVAVDLYPPGSGRQSERQVGQVAETFADLRIDIPEVPAMELTGAQAIVEATLENRTLMAQTELQASRYTAVVEYPVKTMNANERDWIYQTDTGPVLFPDLEASPSEMLERLELAFAAFNSPHWIEWLIRTRTPVSSEVEVNHYSHSVRSDATNRVFAYQ